MDEFQTLPWPHNQPPLLLSTSLLYSPHDNGPTFIQFLDRVPPVKNLNES